MLPIPAMLRWSSSASPIARVRVVVAQARAGSARHRTLGEHVGPQPRRAADRSGARLSVSNSSTGPSNSTTSCPPRSQHEPRPRGDRCQRSPGAYTPHEPVIRRWEWSTSRPRTARTGSCRACRHAVIALPRRRGGHRSRPCEPRCPRAGAGITISSGTRPSSTGRIRVAAHRIVSPSGKRAPPSSRQRQPARALIEPELQQPGTERRGERRSHRRPSRARAA